MLYAKFEILITVLCLALVQAQVVIDNDADDNVNQASAIEPSAIEPSAIEAIVVVHGGAGDIPDSRDEGKHRGTKLAVRLGYNKLLAGGSALDAVEEAVRSMELDENFNAGYGAVLNYDGVVAMDASIMSGENFNAGCVTLVEDILHPISLARRVMENTNHTFLGGDGAMKFAKAQGIPILQPKGQLVTQSAKDALEAFKRDQAMGISTVNAKTETGHNSVDKLYGEPGTVGAVAIDQYGNIAAATSTGGMTGKMVGRIGDSPLLGSGTYADNEWGGVSTTGHGESIMRYNVAQKIVQRIEFLGEDAETATRMVLEAMTEKMMQTAGAITIDSSGNVGFFWTSEKMAWAYRKGNLVHYGIKHGQDIVEPA
jgi:beta-aspartyl-peptidase (threonine type)